MKLSIFIPTLNEEIGLREILPRIISLNPHQILVSDGNSKDRTRDIAQASGVEVYCQRKKGIRHAYIEAWPLLKGDWVVTLSPDGNCVPEDIPRLVDKITKGNHDMVIASRYYGGQKSEDDDIITGFGNWLFTKTVNCLFRGNYTDVMGIFRIYRKNLFYELGLDQESPYRLSETLFQTTVGIEPLLSVRALSYGKKVSEIGSPEPPRLGGERKLQIFRWGAAYYTQFWMEFLFHKKNRPSPQESFS
ncbi:MAG: glycosyltransferase family 2 protein [Verrucomicrobia bacterium]|nr:glycosyltransferase family 2 protein [Verrucomicrobiota bacterium]